MMSGAEHITPARQLQLPDSSTLSKWRSAPRIAPIFLMLPSRRNLKKNYEVESKISRGMSARPMHPPPLITRRAFSKSVSAIRCCDFRCSFQSQK
jgi:hypothetical protein